MGFLRTPLSLGVSVARLGLGLGVDVVKAVAGRVLPGQRSADDTVRPMPTAPPRPDSQAPTRSAPPAGAPTRPPPPPSARPAPPPVEPPPIPDEEAELVAEVGDPSDVGPAVHVEGEPFPGYDALRAPEIIARLRDADESTRAMVRLYEESNKQRRTILEATER